MKLNRLCLLTALLFLFRIIHAQTGDPVFLKSGNFYPEKNIRQQVLDSFNTHAVRVNNKALAVLQFERVPGEREKNALLKSGIELLEYLPDKAYTVGISGFLNLGVLQQSGVQAIFQLSPQQKMETRISSGQIPAWASKVGGTVDVWISFPKTFSAAEAIESLRTANIQLLSSQHAQYRILSLRVAINRLAELAAYPFVEFVQLAPKGDELLLFNSRAGSRASLLNADMANGGKGLNGAGVVVGVGDNADVQTHLDFWGRLINRSPMATNAGHGHHVTGIVGGAGHINDLFRGYASKSTIVSQGFNGIILNAPTYVNDFGMVLTNNSYGDNIECTYFGTYDLYSRLLDQMAFDLPQLQNVFSAGNSGTASCPPFQPTYHNVLGGYQSAKNVLTVGATTDSGMVAAFSSRGPVKDGRTKPEIVAMGQQVASTWAGNIYGFNNGTSMSGPAAVGGLTLLIERYRQLNGGASPKNGLMKAILCNGGSDRGNLGPDYQYGFGWMNLLRSVDMIENNRFFNAAVAQGATNNHNITVPANTTQLKLMLYWNDPAASPLSAKTLVNDLDLEVSDPSGQTILPRILDTSNANLAVPAVNGVDRLNNMEQVVINNPAAGNYTVKVKGTAVNQNPNQEYFVVYDLVPVQLKITSLAGGETWHPTTTALERMRISWEAYGYTGTATLEFSADGGANWSTIASGININRVTYTWWVPDVATNNALVRITKDGTGESATSQPFVIVARPAISLDPVQCEGYIRLNWTSVPGATDYEVMMFRDGEMRPVAISNGNSHTISGLSKDSVYWVTVRARVNGAGGRRAHAISRQPNNGNCAGTISDNDLKIDAMLAPASGRRFTSSQLTATTAVTVRIKNLDDAPVTGFDLKYAVNGGAFITETVNATIAAGATYNHSFATTADLSAIGNYFITVVVNNAAGDPVPVNDTARILVKHLDNQPLDLNTYFTDNLENAIAASYERDTIGLEGIDRYDFSRTGNFGRIRSFFNSGIAYSGSKALTLDNGRFVAAGNTSYLTGTFNLVNYHANTNDLRLDFRFNNHGQQQHANNKVWIRGNDTQPWIEAYDLDDNQNDPGFYKKSASIEISDLLAANGQSLGTSFQVRWGQWGQYAASDKQLAAGYTFDDIRIYEVFNDLQMLAVDSPLTASCALTSAATITVSLRNSDNTAISNIPVKYRINGGGWITETIPSVAANSAIQYSFNTKADLSAIGNYTIQALVDYGADSFRENDTVTTTIVNSPVISSFPYLQNFENNQGNWYSAGKNASWEYGTPASERINRAASGARAWKTRLTGNYNDLEYSYLYSPCFDLAGMSNPTLSFSVALDIEDCGATLCDGAWVEYSTDGINWNKLGASGQGTNWYNKTTHQLWSIQNFTRWHVATIPLPTGVNRLRLRFVLETDPAANREGVAIDDVHIYNHTAGIYDSVTMASPLIQTVSGNNWIDFTSNGKLVASVKANNQTLGATEVQAFINAGAVRYTNEQYYLDRNITIKPANTLLSDSVTVRLYFLDKEADTLARATGCAGCDKPRSAYELGVSKYSDPDDGFENGSISDNQQGMWKFTGADQLAVVPFDKGYFVEYKVLEFSEFWFSSGGFNKNAPLPVKLLDFAAQKTGEDVLLRWKTAAESGVDRYEIELARGDAGLQAGAWTKIGEVASLGNTTAVRDYQLTDDEPDKFGTRYYRLKAVNADGSFVYSPVRSVIFSEAVLWQVYPNPSTGVFQLVYQVNTGEEIVARLVDAKGRLIGEFRKNGNGLAQKLRIDLTPYASGVYLLQVRADGKEQSFKLYKN